MQTRTSVYRNVLRSLSAQLYSVLVKNKLTKPGDQSSTLLPEADLSDSESAALLTINKYTLVELDKVIANTELNDEEIEAELKLFIKNIEIQEKSIDERLFAFARATTPKKSIGAILEDTYKEYAEARKIKQEQTAKLQKAQPSAVIDPQAQSLQTRLEKLEQNLRQGVEKYETEVSNLKTRTSQLEQTLQERDSSLAIVSKNFAALQTTHQQLQIKYNTKKEEKSRLAIECSAAQIENAKLAAEVDALRQQLVLADNANKAASHRTKYIHGEPIHRDDLEQQKTVIDNALNETSNGHSHANAASTALAPANTAATTAASTSMTKADFKTKYNASNIADSVIEEFLTLCPIAHPDNNKKGNSNFIASSEGNKKTPQNEQYKLSYVISAARLAAIFQLMSLRTKLTNNPSQTSTHNESNIIELTSHTHGRAEAHALSINKENNKPRFSSFELGKECKDEMLKTIDTMIGELLSPEAWQKPWTESIEKVLTPHLQSLPAHMINKTDSTDNITIANGTNNSSTYTYQDAAEPVSAAKNYSFSDKNYLATLHKNLSKLNEFGKYGDNIPTYGKGSEAWKIIYGALNSGLFLPKNAKVAEEFLKTYAPETYAQYRKK